MHFLSLRPMMLFLVALLLKVLTFASHPAPGDPVIVTRTGDSALLTSSCQSCPVWTHHFVDGGDAEVYDCNTGTAERYRARFSEQHSNGTTPSTLTITNITTNDAGRYECQNFHSTDTTSFYTNLTVIDESPRCSFASHTELTDKNDSRGRCQTWHRIELFCRVSFHGSLNPNNCLLGWTEIGKEGSLRSECRVSNKTAISTLTLDPKSRRNDSSYKCVVVASSASEPYSCEIDSIDLPSFSTECEMTSSDSKRTSRETHSTTIPDSHISISSSSSSSSSSSFITESFWLLFTLPVLLFLFLRLPS